MSTRLEATGNPTPRSDVDHWRVVCWRGRGSLSFEGPSIMVVDAYGKTVGTFSLAAASSGVSCLMMDSNS